MLLDEYSLAYNHKRSVTRLQPHTHTHISNSHVLHPVLALVELLRVCLVLVSRAKRCVPPLATAAPADLPLAADADADGLKGAR